MIAIIQGAQRSHLIIFPFIANFFFSGDIISCAPPNAHAHEQKALPKINDPIKSSMNIKKLPHIIPFALASTIT
jgi:hypothetical protein